MQGLSRTLFATDPYPYTVDFAPYSSMRPAIETTVKTMFNSPSARLHYLPDIVLTILYIAAVNNARISEILSIRYCDHLGGSRFLCRGKKRGYDYTVQLMCLVSPPQLKWHCVDKRPIFSIGYKRIWTWCRAAGLGFTPECRFTVARTHAHRYHTADAVCEISGISSVQGVLHHRAATSAEYYLSAKERKNGENTVRRDGSRQRQNRGRGRC
jgi:hypothetical protein